MRRRSACASYEAAEASGARSCEALVSWRGLHAAVKALGATMPPLMLATRDSGTVRGEATQ
eukprot:4712746-Prymnesium_polylepis.1